MKRRPCHQMPPVMRMIVAAMVLIAFSGCRAWEGANRINLSLSKYLEQTGESWFLTGKKEYAIQAMMVSAPLSFHNELENVDYVATDDGETVVLRGTRAKCGHLRCRRSSRDMQSQTAAGCAREILRREMYGSTS